MNIASIQAKDIKLGDIIKDSGANNGLSYPVDHFRTVSGNIEIFCGKCDRIDVDTRTRYIMHPQDGLCIYR